MKRKKQKLKRLLKLLCVITVAVTVIIFIKDYNENKREIESKNSVCSGVTYTASETGNANQELDAVEYLTQIAENDDDIGKILENKEKYPEILLEMLSRNLDMKEYMLSFPDLKGKTFSDNIGMVKKGEYPLLLQYDKRWGYGIYGEDVIAVEGCGPTALSTVIAGLTGKNNITPHDIAKYAKNNGYYDGGTSWSFFTKGVNHFGISGKEVPLSENSILNELKQGHPIICSVRKGDFTTTGHIIAIVGTKNGKFVVRDPNSTERSQRLWSFEKLHYQIKNLWSFEAK